MYQEVTVKVISLRLLLIREQKNPVAIKNRVDTVWCGIYPQDTSPLQRNNYQSVGEAHILYFFVDSQRNLIKNVKFGE